MTAARLALVGNPNSGKTALFNRLTGSRQVRVPVLHRPQPAGGSDGFQCRVILTHGSHHPRQDSDSRIGQRRPRFFERPLTAPDRVERIRRVMIAEQPEIKHRREGDTRGGPEQRHQPGRRKKIRSPESYREMNAKKSRESQQRGAIPFCRRRGTHGGIVARVSWQVKGK